MALMKGVYKDSEGVEYIVDLKLNADGKLEISGLQVDTLEMGSLQIASGSDASELQITNGAAKEIPLIGGPTLVTGLAGVSLSAGEVDGQDIDFKNYRTITVRYRANGTGTIQFKLQFKATNGNWYDDTENIGDTIAINGSGKGGIGVHGYYVDNDTIRVAAIVTGSLTGVAASFVMKS